MSNGPGTYREADGSKVEFADAERAWARAARPILIDTAHHYHETITYKDLAIRVQTAAGIQTRMLITHWIGGVLGSVARDCHQRSEPLLSALCVRADGTIGDGYAVAIAETYGETSVDTEIHGAEERLRCYQHFGATLPAGGGRPALTSQVAKKRERAAHRAVPPTPVSVCPECHMVLPMSKRCYTCANASR